MSITQGEGRILSAIYQTADELYAGLLCSTSVFIFLFVCPFRHATPRLMAAVYVLVIITSVLMLLRNCVQLYYTAGEYDELLWLSLCFLSMGCLLELWPDERNRETYYFCVPKSDVRMKGVSCYAECKK